MQPELRRSSPIRTPGSFESVFSIRFRPPNHIGDRPQKRESGGPGLPKANRAEQVSRTHGEGIARLDPESYAGLGLQGPEILPDVTDCKACIARNQLVQPNIATSHDSKGLYRQV